MNRLKTYIGIIVLATIFAGCSQEKRVPIYEHFWAPDSFSPNDDGMNEEFRVITPPYVQLTNFHMSIYNEQLRLMFETNDIFKSWNGNYEVGMQAPAGFYEYQIIYTASTDSINYEAYVTSSKINLIR